MMSSPDLAGSSLHYACPKTSWNLHFRRTQADSWNCGENTGRAIDLKIVTTCACQWLLAIFFFPPPSKWMILFILLFFVGKSAFCRPVPGYSYRKVERAEARLRRAPTHKAMVLKGLFMTICACKRLQGFCFLCVGTKYRNERPLLPNGPQTPSWSLAVKMSFPQTARTR